MLLRKTIAAACWLILISGGGVLAQQPQTSTTVQRPEGLQRGPGLRRMKGRRERNGFGLLGLNLTEEQKQRTRAILEQHLESTRAQRDELMKLREKREANLFTAEDGARAKELHQQLHDSRQSIRAEINGMLTPEQRTQLEQFENQQKARRDEMSNRGRRFRCKDPIQ